MALFIFDRYKVEFPLVSASFSTDDEFSPSELFTKKNVYRYHE